MASGWRYPWTAASLLIEELYPINEFGVQVGIEMCSLKSCLFLVEVVVVEVKEGRLLVVSLRQTWWVGSGGLSSLSFYGGEIGQRLAQNDDGEIVA